MKAYIVDDEPLARERLQTLLESCLPRLDITGKSGTATDAVQNINEEKPDVVFLDIQMPGLDGFDVISLLEEPLPYIVFVTAYDEYAIKAFEVYALDYLTKPVRLERLQQTLQNLEKRAAEKRQEASLQKAIKERKKESLRVLTVKKGRKIKVLELNEVYSIEADDKLNYAHTEKAKYLVDHTLDELENRLDSTLFVRIHRSSIVNLQQVEELIPWFSGTYEIKLKNDRQLSVARRRVSDLKEKLGM